MKLPWFKRIGFIFLPISATGWSILILALLYGVYIFIDIDSRSHSVSDTLMNFVFNLLIIVVVYSIIAALTSRESSS